MVNKKQYVLSINGKRIYESVFEAIAKFNAGYNKIILRALGGNISNGIETAQILRTELGIKILESNIKTFSIADNISERSSRIDKTGIDILLESNGFETKKDSKSFKSKNGSFIGFPIYHLTLDWLLYQRRAITINDHKNNPLLSIKLDQMGTIKYKLKIAKQENTRSFSRVNAALCKSGVIFPENIFSIAKKISKADDVILGLDTNILYNCNITEHLIPALNIINSQEYVKTPNWILLIIPSGVMHELEESTNIRNDNGFLQHEGRMGFRALQEIITLNISNDLQGISLVGFGQANPTLDTRVEIQGLRQDLQKLESAHINTDKKKVSSILKSRKTSSGDMIIRDQFKRFLRQIDFHKGVYFLTSDKSNAALAQTEGLNSIYFKNKVIYSTREVIDQYRITEYGGNEIKMDVPLGKLIYELAVQFGTIKIDCGKRPIKLECDSKGESLAHWVNRNIRIEDDDFDRLLASYDGEFDLHQAEMIFKKLNKALNASGIFS